MEVAVITDEIDADLDHALDVMAEYGIVQAELRQVWDKNIADTTPDDWARIKASMDAHGAKVIGLATPFYKCDLPGESAGGPAGPLHSASARGLGDQIALLEHCIAAARFFDTRLLRVFSFWKRGPLTPEIEDTIVDALAEPIQMAQAAGVVLGLENEHACYIGTGAQSARILEKINSPHLRSIWDPGNAFFDGEIPYPAGYEAVKKYVEHVHIKDASAYLGSKGPEWTVVGEGEIDLRGQLEALRGSGYDGYISLETHYNGKGSKEASSRACLDGLLKLLS